MYSTNEQTAAFPLASNPAEEISKNPHGNLFSVNQEIDMVKTLSFDEFYSIVITYFVENIKRVIVHVCGRAALPPDFWVYWISVALVYVASTQMGVAALSVTIS